MMTPGLFPAIGNLLPCCPRILPGVYDLRGRILFRVCIDTSQTTQHSPIRLAVSRPRRSNVRSPISFGAWATACAASLPPMTWGLTFSSPARVCVLSCNASIGAIRSVRLVCATSTAPSSTPALTWVSWPPPARSAAQPNALPTANRCCCSTGQLCRYYLRRCEIRGFRYA
jgi:hypothetical protein